jgi:predicted DsbA family dithiol-disulfide isomerase
MTHQHAGVAVDVYSDVVCPWCYVGKRRLERAQSQLPTVATQVIWRPFQLNPTMPQEGMDRRTYLEAKFGSQDSYRRLEEHVAVAGASEGISFAFERMRKTPNTFLAHRLIWYAGKHDQQNFVVDALFKAYFEQGADIGSQAVLTDLAASAGLEAARLPAALRGKLILGFVGYVRAWHGLPQVVDLLAHDPALADAALLIVGDGPGTTDLLSRARALV